MSNTDIPGIKKIEKLLGLSRLAESAFASSSIIKDIEVQQAAFMNSAGIREAMEVRVGLLESMGATFSVQSVAVEEMKNFEAMQRSIVAARSVGQLNLPDFIEQYRVPDLSFTAQYAEALRRPWWEEHHLALLNSHSALANMLAQTEFVRSATLASVESLLSEPFQDIRTLREAREFLDLSGLLRYPRFRVLSRSEKKRKIAILIDDSTPKEHVISAHSLNHRNEKVLRLAIDGWMSQEYGDDWLNERLPVCGCKGLLRKTLDDDESILDQADFHHYAEIMCHPEHFERAFSSVFESPDDLRTTLKRLGRLRAKSHHARTFTPEDLREMGTLWSVVEVVFEVLVDDVILTSDPVSL